MPVPRLVNRAKPPTLALESTLLTHGVPRDRALEIAAELARAVTAADGRVTPAVVGVHRGVPTVGLTDEELAAVLADDGVVKANPSSLPLAVHRGRNAATTVATTMQLAAAAGVRVFATGGIGGVHPGLATRPDISADLAALARYPVAVVASGAKSILDLGATRELLETAGVPVIGFGTDRLPAFYLRESEEMVDERFDDPEDLARFLDGYLGEDSGGALICNPIPHEAAMQPAEFEGFLKRAESVAAGATGRDATPAILGALHDVSEGRTLEANIALALSNASLGSRLAGLMSI